jgi:hypothetical protein
VPLRSPAVTGKKAMLNAMGNETGGLGDEDARAFVRKFGLRNYDEWREYAKSGDKPHDIPYDPYNAYAETAPHSL